jgi:hypothetical protein
VDSTNGQAPFIPHLLLISSRPEYFFGIILSKMLNLRSRLGTENQVADSQKTGKI